MHVRRAQQHLRVLEHLRCIWQLNEHGLLNHLWYDVESNNTVQTDELSSPTSSPWRPDVPMPTCPWCAQQDLACSSRGPGTCHKQILDYQRWGVNIVILYMFIHTLYIYIYIYREREIYRYIYIYIYIRTILYYYTHYTSLCGSCDGAADPRESTL